MIGLVFVFNRFEFLVGFFYLFFIYCFFNYVFRYVVIEFVNKYFIDSYSFFIYKCVPNFFYFDVFVLGFNYFFVGLFRLFSFFFFSLFRGFYHVAVLLVFFFMVSFLFF